MPHDESVEVPLWRPVDSADDDHVAPAPQTLESPDSRPPVPLDRAVDRRIDELAASVRELVMSERDAVIQQAWVEANAWAEQQVATELARLRDEADERLAAGVERETRRLEQHFESQLDARVEEVVGERLDAAVELIVPQRVESALAEMAADHAAALADLRAQLAHQADTQEQARAAALAELAQRHAAELRQVKAQAEEMLARRFYDKLAASPDPPTIPVAPAGDSEAEIAHARQQEREAVLAEIDRLRRGMSRLDDARTLSEVLDALSDALKTEVARLAVIKVGESDVVLWQSHGFEPELDREAVRAAAGRPGVLARVLETGVPCFVQPSDDDGEDDLGFARVSPSAAGLVAPILVDEQVIALVYADGPGAPDASYRTWPEVVGVLTRHAGRCLDALSAFVRASGPVPTANAAAFDHRLTDDDIVDLDGVTDRRETERRSSARKGADQMPWLGDVSMQPGHDVSLVNLSDGGALVETASRLAPGSSVLLQFIGPGGERVSGEVLRCAVFTFSDGRTAKYRGAVKFSEPLSRFFERAAQPAQGLAPVAGAIDVVPGVQDDSRSASSR